MSGTNNSSSGGFVSPGSAIALPRNLTFTQFLQTILVGISGFRGDLVRPDWQENPPKQPDIKTDWLAFGVSESDPGNGFPYAGLDTNGNYNFQKHECVTIQCSMYGPGALENYRMLRDGFYLPQNNEQLVANGFGLIGVSKATRAPELIDERWFNKWIFFVQMYYETQRTYPVLSFQSASGKVFAPVATDSNFSVSWLVQSA